MRGRVEYPDSPNSFIAGVEPIHGEIELNLAIEMTSYGIKRLYSIRCRANPWGSPLTPHPSPLTPVNIGHTLRKTMVEKITAVFDGKVFHPDEPIALKANTRVRITIETVPPDVNETASFLKTARSLNLDGPPDWSANLDEYLYGRETQHES